MKYALPFGLTQKPLTHYFNHGVVKFNIQGGKLIYTIKAITKLYNGPIMTGEVVSKVHLDDLLAIKSLNEIPTIEVVN